MTYPTQFHHQFRKPQPATHRPQTATFDVGTPIRARVGQDAEHRLWYASAPDLLKYIAFYAINTWAYTAVSRLAEAAASAPLRVTDRDDETVRDEDHPIARLLGEWGSPNEYQTSIEFWEEHFTHLELAGNAFWYLESVGGGSPSALHILPPDQMRIHPGKLEHVATYEYIVQGHRYDLNPANVLHFRRPNPMSKYWGLSAFQALGLSIAADVAASEWNRDFFGDGVAVPAGVLVIPASVSERERDRLDREWNAKHGQRRRTAIIRSEPGSVMWYQAGLAKRDYDFESGRKLTRQEVYEALGLPLGYLSEASTEAHARVAERQYLHAVHIRHQRTANRITAKLMPYFPGWRGKCVRFRDVRMDALDWKEQATKIKAIAPFISTNEMRTQHLGMESINGGDDLTFTDRREAQSAGEGGPVQPEGQIRDMVEPGE